MISYRPAIGYAVVAGLVCTTCLAADKCTISDATMKRMVVAACGKYTFDLGYEEMPRRCVERAVLSKMTTISDYYSAFSLCDDNEAASLIQARASDAEIFYDAVLSCVGSDAKSGVMLISEQRKRMLAGRSNGGCTPATKRRHEQNRPRLEAIISAIPDSRQALDRAGLKVDLLGHVTEK